MVATVAVPENIELIDTAVTKVIPCFPQICRNRYVWLQEQCQCVCPPYFCPKGTVRGNDCDCIEITTLAPSPSVQCEPSSPCPRSWFWNHETCECQVGCDFIKKCPIGFQWDIFKCDCIAKTTVAPSPSVQCEQTSPCPRSWFWNYETCKCQLGCDFIKECPIGFKWDLFKCDCIAETTVAPSPSKPCEQMELCIRGYIWNYKTCKCQPGCDIVQICQRGYTWDSIKCGCVQTPFASCPSIECSENQVLNAATCNCDCTISAADCSGPLAEYDPIMCTCKRHPCDPPYPCPDGQIIDFQICNCVPDPSCPSASSPPCKPQACAKGYSWNQALCCCELTNLCWNHLLFLWVVNFTAFGACKFLLLTLKIKIKCLKKLAKNFKCSCL